MIKTNELNIGQVMFLIFMVLFVIGIIYVVVIVTNDVRKEETFCKENYSPLINN